ncbi:MAG: hypothetical protein EZS28_055915, partial [Streblomastix strix]
MPLCIDIKQLDKIDQKDVIEKKNQLKGNSGQNNQRIGERVRSMDKIIQIWIQAYAIASSMKSNSCGGVRNAVDVDNC